MLRLNLDCLLRPTPFDETCCFPPSHLRLLQQFYEKGRSSDIEDDPEVNFDLANLELMANTTSSPLLCFDDFRLEQYSAAFEKLKVLSTEHGLRMAAAKNPTYLPFKVRDGEEKN